MTVTRERARRSGLGPTRTEVLTALRSAGTALSVARIATAVELHPNSARFHLDALVEQGLVVRQDEQRDRPGRPRVLYRAAPYVDSDADAMQSVARALVRHLSRLEGGAGEQAEAAGRLWGEEIAAATADVAPLQRIMSTLDTLGYQPRPGESGETIVLTPCPLRVLLGESGADGLPPVCRLHLGLMRGLVGDDPSCSVTGLEALVTPDTCLAHLQHRPATPA
ncbi:MAG: helix-turn-helix domain-containing protein [Propionicimonas sp.]|nr:helix-turn-helix domain-containing protein [Propionicimonas sp.]